MYLTKGIIELHILDRQKEVLTAIQQNCMAKIDNIIINDEHLKRQQKSLTSPPIEPALDISRLNN